MRPPITGPVRTASGGPACGSVQWTSRRTWVRAAPPSHRATPCHPRRKAAPPGARSTTGRPHQGDPRHRPGPPEHALGPGEGAPLHHAPRDGALQPHPRHVCAGWHVEGRRFVTDSILLAPISRAPRTSAASRASARARDALLEDIVSGPVSSRTPARAPPRPARPPLLKITVHDRCLPPRANPATGRSTAATPAPAQPPNPRDPAQKPAPRDVQPRPRLGRYQAPGKGHRPYQRGTAPPTPRAPPWPT
jgi:hypothetical protein